jgi:hypothetical protein
MSRSGLFVFRGQAGGATIANRDTTGAGSGGRIRIQTASAVSKATLAIAAIVTRVMRRDDLAGGTVSAAGDAIA